MKKTIILLSSLVSMAMFGQEHHHEDGHYCAADAIRADLEKQNPEIKAKRLQLEKNLREKGLEGVLRESGFSLSNSNLERLQVINEGENRSANAWEAYNGPIYEIPIVVHLIESTNPIDAKLTNEQIQTWIENANKILATTYGNGYYSEGEGIDKGTVMPFKLVLAKRTINNEPTTGIIRYDGSSLQGYNEYGMANYLSSTSRGVKEAEIRRFAPHWSEDHYYNLYLVTAFDGRRDGNGLLGYAYPPDAGNVQYDGFLKAYEVTKPHSYILAHEIGHSLGLLHTFHNGGSTTACPDPTKNNDGVEDTEPIKSFLGRAVPTNNDINECTGRNYEGGQYNIMNYTNQPRKFTVGQRDRVLTSFLTNRAILTKSLGGKEPETCTGEELGVKPLVTPITKSTAYGGTFYLGLRDVTIGNIHNPHPGLQIAYRDYTTTASCMSKAYRTNLVEGEEVTITIVPSQGSQSVAVWIDYNDNGSFENEERLFIQSTKGNTITHTFIPPANAVKEKYIRMRVKGDYDQAFYMQVNRTDYGETEDYAVRIVPKNWVDPDNIKPSNDNYIGRLGINTEEPKATLDVRETTDVPETQPQGVLFPIFTTEQRATFQDVAEGTMIFNSSLKCLEIYSNGVWKCLN